jgi:PAS domain S-box-containing protein
VKWLLANAMPLGATPNPAGVVTTFSDITAYIQAQRQIRLSEERYRGLVEALPLMVAQADRNLHATFANPAIKEQSGYDLADFADPQTWRRLVHPEDLPRLLIQAQEALAGRPGRLELRYRAKDGSEKITYTLLQPTWQDGSVAGVLALLLDITRERRLERDLQRAQRLELIGRLSSGIAHDFNNLLTVILGVTERARLGLAADSPVQADLHWIGVAGQQAANLAGQLLALCKQRQITPTRLDVNEVVNRTLDLLRTTLPSNIQVETSLSIRPLFILADDTQLQQVLMNLCLNARDAMPQGGRLCVKTEAAEDPHSSTAWALMAVHDEGPGISEELKAQIFEPFFSTKERGTGLGLAVVQQIVESYGGRVEVTSQPGHGAHFDVWLPLLP